MTHLPHDTGIAARIGRYSDAVEVTGPMRWLATSGTPGLDAEGRLPAEFETQADLAWRNVVAALEKAGMGVGDIVRVTQYLVRRGDMAAYPPIRARWLGDARPASMLLVVAALPWPDMLIEIQVDAAKAP